VFVHGDKESWWASKDALRFERLFGGHRSLARVHRVRKGQQRAQTPADGCEDSVKGVEYWSRRMPWSGTSAE